MLIGAGYDIAFEADRPTLMLAALSIHPSRNRDQRSMQRITTVPEDGLGRIIARVAVAVTMVRRDRPPNGAVRL